MVDSIFGSVASRKPTSGIMSADASKVRLPYDWTNAPRTGSNPTSRISSLISWRTLRQRSMSAAKDGEGPPSRSRRASASRVPRSRAFQHCTFE